MVFKERRLPRPVFEKRVTIVLPYGKWPGTEEREYDYGRCFGPYSRAMGPVSPLSVFRE
jgi:hypothetical protein